MLKRDISKINVTGKKQRDIVKTAEKFITEHKCADGQILVLFGLRRTGKTTIMEQLIDDLHFQEKCAFYELENHNTMQDVKKVIIDEQKKGTTLICFDEITKANDFITDSAALPDIFAKEGMSIILAGTDSLGFRFAEDTELYDRTTRLRTTHISFAEHSRILGTRDIDDYIMYGGLMRKGASENEIHDYESTKKYLDSAVSDNIAISIKNDPHESQLELLSIKEIRAIIEKMVELYSGIINKKNVQELLKNASVNYPVNKVSGFLDEKEAIHNLVEKKPDITSRFSHVINADVEISCEITSNMVKEFENYLIEMDLLSVTPKTTFSYTDELGWNEIKNEKEFYVIQPAIKYYHLQKGMDFINEEDFYLCLSEQTKNLMKRSLDEKIKGDMIEQIILFDTNKLLNKEKYGITKPVFYINGQNKGEYDMLIHDKIKNMCWGFEIKHTENPCFEQTKNLVNNEFTKIIEEKYGKREFACVLYRGTPFIDEANIIYLNITDFMLAIDVYKDVSKTMCELTKGLEKHNSKENIHEGQIDINQNNSKDDTCI